MLNNLPLSSQANTFMHNEIRKGKNSFLEVEEGPLRKIKNSTAILTSLAVSYWIWLTISTHSRFIPRHIRNSRRIAHSRLLAGYSLTNACVLWPRDGFLHVSLPTVAQKCGPALAFRHARIWMIAMSGLFQSLESDRNAGAHYQI